MVMDEIDTCISSAKSHVSALVLQPHERNVIIFSSSIVISKSWSINDVAFVTRHGKKVFEKLKRITEVW